MQFRAVDALFVAAMLLLAVVCGVAAAAASSRQIAAVIAVLVTAVILVRIGSWRVVYAITLTLLLIASSNFFGLAEDVYYPRYIAGGVLAIWTWRHPRVDAFKDQAASLRLLVRALWVAVAVAVVSVTWSIDRGTTIQQTIALIILAAIIHGLAVRRWADRTLICGDLGVAYTLIVVAAAAGLALDYLGYETARGFADRLQGIFANPNTLAYLSAVAVLVGWAIYNGTGRKIVLLGLPFLVASIVMSESRTAVLAVIVGAAWVFVRDINGRSGVRAFWLGGAALAYVTAAAAGLVPTFAFNVTARFSSTTPGGILNSRGLAWNDVINLLHDQPFTGYGYGAGPTLFSDLYSQGAIDFSIPVVHNSYLQWALETGLVGLVPLVLLVAAVIAAAWRRPPERADFGGAVLVGLLVMITESAMFGTGQAFPLVYWPVVAAAVVMASKPIEAPFETVPARSLEHS